MDKNTKKEDIIKLVDKAGKLKFDNWYKNQILYTNDEYTVSINPAYSDCCKGIETLEDLLTCEDYGFVYVFKGTEKPWAWEWYKEGDI